MHRLSIAPMLDWTDRHYRFFMRGITGRTLLYTEMLTTGALLHGDAARFLRFDVAEHPLALQLGGSDPRDLARCARMGEEWAYDEVNLNCGCPSDRVQSGRFGACLMAEPRVVAECVAAMREAVTIPVTVKHRIGIDEQDSYQALCDFVGEVATGGCGRFVVHARKAWLQGLSPKENREIPPLRYDRVYRLKQDFPRLDIILNGGVQSLDDAAVHLQQVDGVMIGREAYNNPWSLAEADVRLLGAVANPSRARAEAVARMLPYIERELAGSAKLNHVTRHMLGLYHGQPRARHWRRALGEGACQRGVGVEVVRRALAEMGEVS